MTFIVLFISAVWIQPPLPRFLQHQQQNHNIKFWGQLFIFNKLVTNGHMFFFFSILFYLTSYLLLLIDISLFFFILLMLFFVFLYFFSSFSQLGSAHSFYICINCFFFWTCPNQSFQTTLSHLRVTTFYEDC